MGSAPPVVCAKLRPIVAVEGRCDLVVAVAVMLEVVDDERCGGVSFQKFTGKH